MVYPGKGLMDPIQDIKELYQGDVVHHPALGFAIVDQVEQGSARLAWESNGARLPPLVSTDLLAKGYRRCIPGGFLYRSVIEKSSLRLLVDDQPVQALRLLLDDLGERQGRAEIRDWMTGRDIMSTAEFDRWWAELEGSEDIGTLQWSSDRRKVGLTNVEVPTDPEAFLGSPPRGRWQIAGAADTDARIRLLHQAIVARDTDAILLLMRVQKALPPDATAALRKLARNGDHGVTAALLDRKDPQMIRTMVGPASRPNTQERVLTALDRLPPTRRAQVAVAIIEEALTMEGDPPAAEWLCSAISGGTKTLMETASLLEDVPNAMTWLESRAESDELLSVPTVISTRDTIEYNPNNAPTPSAQLIANLREIAADRIFPISIGIAKALSERHGNGETGGIPGARIDVAGVVELGPAEARTPRDDVRDAMRLVLEAVVGPLPADAHLNDGDLLPHINQLRADLPVEWIAVCMQALAQDLDSRPSNGTVLWTQLARANASQTVRDLAPAIHQNINIAHDTHIGIAKSRRMQTNQDAAFYAQAGRVSIMLVADGISVSTAGSGNLASALLVQSIAGQWEADSAKISKMKPQEVMGWIEQSLIRGNESICKNSMDLAQGDLSQQIPMGTTAILAIIRDSTLYVASLGDSRAYLVTDSGVALLTGDQNVRGLWLCAHKEGSPLPNVADEGFALVGYCGRFDQNTEPSPAEPVTRIIRLLESDTLLLCSDGLTDYAAGTIDGQSEVVAEGATFADLNKGCRYLIERANEGGGGDNVTVMLARIAND